MFTVPKSTNEQKASVKISLTSWIKEGDKAVLLPFLGSEEELQQFIRRLVLELKSIELEAMSRI